MSQFANQILEFDDFDYYNPYYQNDSVNTLKIHDFLYMSNYDDVRQRYLLGIVQSRSKSISILAHSQI